MLTPPNPRPPASINQRRSQRILLAVPLLISGIRVNGAPFAERSKSLVVNAHGGLIILHEPVLSGQVLTMINVATSEDIVCTVIDINPGAAGTPEVGVEFVEPCPRFWRVSFPPSDWTPRSPEAKRFAQGKSQSGVTPAIISPLALTKK